LSRSRAEEQVARARLLGSSEEIRDFYRDWAADYDRHVAGDLQFTGGETIAAMLVEHLADRSARIIDIGCGTGLAGQALQAAGCTQIDGLDLSPAMLEQARAKSVYRSLLEADLLEPLAIATKHYDAAISAGTFTTGHVDARCLGEVLRILRPGGLLACVVAETFWHPGGFADWFADRSDNGAIAILDHGQQEISQACSGKGHFVVCRKAG
jgi:predicted TPR repeat methyltransferase